MAREGGKQVSTFEILPNWPDECWTDETDSPEDRATVAELRFRIGGDDLAGVIAFEAGVDPFVGSVLQRLEYGGLRNSALRRTYAELRAEREDPKVAHYRRIEARLGYDVDDAPEELVRRIWADGLEVGNAAMEELAADRSLSNVAAGADLHRIAHRSGHVASVDDGVRLGASVCETSGRVAPFTVGVQAAEELREQVRLGDAPVSDAALTQMYGVDRRCLERGREAPFAFSLRGERGLDPGASNRLVLCARGCAGRRFELARLLGDRLVFDNGEALSPTTRAATFRQKAQRAFAAELLCPLKALRTLLDGDCSEDAMEAAARHFRVSPLVVRAQLANQGLSGSSRVEEHQGHRESLDAPSVSLASGDTAPA